MQGWILYESSDPLCYFSISAHSVFFSFIQLQPQEISPPPTANLDRSNDKVYENVTGLVKAVIEMSSKIQPAPPEEYVPMVKVGMFYPLDL
jgi:hypothetical protein